MAYEIDERFDEARRLLHGHEASGVAPTPTSLLELLRALGGLLRRSKRAAGPVAELLPRVLALASSHPDVLWSALAAVRPEVLAESLERLRAQAEAFQVDDEGAPSADLEAEMAAAKRWLLEREEFASILSAIDCMRAHAALSPQVDGELGRMKAELERVDTDARRAVLWLAPVNSFRRAERAGLDRPLDDWWWTLRADCPEEILRFRAPSPELRAHALSCAACRRDIDVVSALQGRPTPAHHPLREIERLALQGHVAERGGPVEQHLGRCPDCLAFYRAMTLVPHFDTRPGRPPPVGLWCESILRLLSGSDERIALALDELGRKPWFGTQLHRAGNSVIAGSVQGRTLQGKLAWNDDELNADTDFRLKLVHPTHSYTGRAVVLRFAGLDLALGEFQGDRARLRLVENARRRLGGDHITLRPGDFLAAVDFEVAA